MSLYTREYKLIYNNGNLLCPHCTPLVCELNLQVAFTGLVNSKSTTVVYVCSLNVPCKFSCICQIQLYTSCIHQASLFLLNSIFLSHNKSIRFKLLLLQLIMVMFLMFNKCSNVHVHNNQFEPTR